MKVQIIKVDLYNHFFNKPEVVEGTDVVDCAVKYYDVKDPEIYKEVKESLIKELAVDNYQFPGLGTNPDGGWRISGEETIILIMPVE